MTERFEERFFDLSVDLLCCLGFDGHFERLNPAWERVLGFSREELMSKPFIEFVHPDDRERTLNQNRKVRSGEQALGFENRYLCKDGSYRWFLWNAAADSDRNSIYSVARDITERKTHEMAMARLSVTDELTGLWNRRGFTTLAAKELERAKRSDAYVLLFFIDLDLFKQINDRHGHAEGDTVLVDVARLLQESCRGSDIVARLGGDEFAIFAVNDTGMGESIMVNRIALGLAHLNDEGGRDYDIDFTIGVAGLGPGEKAELSTLLARADEQMYRKKRGKGSGG